MAENGKSRRGFASMSPERRAEIASKGGKAAHKAGTAHQWDSNEARKAGAKGGSAIAARPGYMAEIGRRGGKNKGRNAFVRDAVANTDALNATGD